MTILERINPLSVAKISALFGIFPGIIFGIFAMFLGIMMRYTNPLILLLLLICGFVLGIVCGVIYGLVVSLLYNFSSGVVGGIKFEMQKRGKESGAFALNSIDPVSYGRIEAISVAVVLVVTVVLILLVNAILNTGISVALIAGFGVLGIVLGALVGFVAGWLNGYFYNFIVLKIEAVKFTLASRKGSFNNILQYVDYMSYAKVNAGLIALWSVISLVIRVILVLLLILFVGSKTTYLGGTTIVFGIFGGLFGILVGFVISIVMAILYNMFAKRIGGIQVNLK